ncbi:MAG: hypothetical protein WD794_05765 [Mycobacteriales bacterium]
MDKRIVGVIEAKPEGTPLSGVQWQSGMYATGLPESLRRRAVEVDGRLPFVFEASGSETHFTNGLEPLRRARRCAGFPRPETLARWLRDRETSPAAPTWRSRVQTMPAVPGRPEGMRPAQTVAIAGIERSLREGPYDRSLAQMATGAGKTYTAVSEPSTNVSPSSSSDASGNNRGDPTGDRGRQRTVCSWPMSGLKSRGRRPSQETKPRAVDGAAAGTSPGTWPQTPQLTLRP